MQTINPKSLPPFIQQEMDKIATMIRPLMKKVSIFYLIGLPLFILGVLNMVLPFLSTEFSSISMTARIVYAIVAAVGISLFRESQFLKKQMHQTVKRYIAERIKKSVLIEEHEKTRYVTRVNKQKQMDLPLFFHFLTEEHKRKERHYM
jgi:uncharacterized membrane protein YuzA (DUF378 family)